MKLNAKLLMIALYEKPRLQVRSVPMRVSASVVLWFWARPKS